MKAITSIYQYGIEQDCVINYFVRPEKDNKNKVVWSNEKDRKAKSRITIENLTLYLTDEDADKCSVIILSPCAIKSLYNALVEVESKVIEIDMKEYED